MATVTKKQMIDGLKRVGLVKGDHVFVHSALGSLETVRGGAETFIDAIIELVGPSGTVAVPTFACSGEAYDPATSETGLGAIPRAFWKREQACRSRHPLASIAAIGAEAEWLIENHEKAKTAHGKGSPYARLGEIDGKVLLVGVDLDRVTALHTAETIAELPYLRSAKAAYLDDKGRTVSRTWPFFPGPHRDFIGLQRWFEESELARKARIGPSVIQCLPVKEVLHALAERLQDEPALFISKNPNLPDGIWQRAAILREKIAKEPFSLAVDSLYAGRYIEEIIAACARHGIESVVLSFVNRIPWHEVDSAKRRWYRRGLRDAGIEVAALKLTSLIGTAANDLAKEAKTDRVIVPSPALAGTGNEVSSLSCELLVENAGMTADQIFDMLLQSERRRQKMSLAFNPLEFTKMCAHPFGVYSHSKLKKYATALYINDGLMTGERTLLEQGLAEIKELVSILRSRSFGGLFILQGDREYGVDRNVQKFFSMLEELGKWPEK